jgi:hypothetical protein
MSVVSKKTTIDYKRELEGASKGMIMIHEPATLIKLIIRMIVRKVRVRHAGMIIHEPRKDAYILTISRGEVGVKIPAGFARFDKSNPIIKFFTHKEYRRLTQNRHALLIHDIHKLIWQESLIKQDEDLREFLYQIEEHLKMLNTVACVPAYYHNHLLAILLLGEKKGGSRFEPDEIDFFEALASDVAMAIRNAQLFADLKNEAHRNKELFLQTTIVLGSTIEAKDEYTHGHTERVINYALAIARQMENNGSAKFPEGFFDNLYIAGMLHDIGKIGIPEAILNKKGRLTEEEFNIMKKHTLKGVEILKPLAEFRDCMDGVKYHHERYDGKGYPEGLKGDEIPLIAAIIAAADTFDAITTDRPYRKGLTKEEAIAEIKKNSGGQFHPLAVQALLELYEKSEI